MNPYAALVLPMAHSLVLVLLLIGYRLKKRFKERPINGVWAFADHNIVELILGAILAPAIGLHIIDILHTLLK